LKINKPGKTTFRVGNRGIL